MTAQTTEEYWTVDGTPLNNLAYNIETLSGRRGIPPRRGSNIVVPYLPGTVWVPKQPHERQLTLGMWVQDKQDDGTIPSGEQARRAQLNDNIASLEALFGVYNTLLSIEQRVRTGSGLETWSAQAECVGTLPFEFDEGSQHYAKFVVELVLPYPFWTVGS